MVRKYKKGDKVKISNEGNLIGTVREGNFVATGTMIGKNPWVIVKMPYGETWVDARDLILVK